MDLGDVPTCRGSKKQKPSETPPPKVPKFSSAMGLEQKLKDEVEELKADSVEKENRIAHLEVKLQELTSSMEKAQKETITAFMRSAEFKTCLDCHYAASYEDFRADAKEAYLEMDFDSFVIPTAAESSLLPMSSEDVNVVDDATTEMAQDDPKSVGDASSGLSQ
ncbi:hypothetical protein SO802_002554 [Lithocarpus litseifolius]|uniref:Uncharacterized protein n=1 Tax=Lithocarpus litseifolius TaxID=425828 RepID=A0AAW2E1K7_9ROSI